MQRKNMSPFSSQSTYQLVQKSFQNNTLILLNFLKKGYDDDEEINNVITLIASTNEEHWRIDGYCNEWLPRYLDIDFFRLYRMSKSTFYKLLRALECEEKCFVVGGGQLVPLDQALLMTISWLGKGETLIRISEIFNVACSTVFGCTEFMLSKLIALKKKVIIWPDVQEMVAVQASFLERSGFPGVIGAVDVCNIKFTAPKEQESYCDKNKNHSIKLQAIVTADKIFTNIMAGYPGSAHDSRVFRNSKIFLEVEEYGNFRKYFGAENYHLVGDKAYPLKNWILTPFKNNGNLTHRQRRSNTHHSNTRFVVEHTFGLLKGRWRILHHIHVNSIEKATKVIIACCVLHNFCFINSDLWEEYEAVEHDNDEAPNAGDVPLNAINKRNEIADLF